MPTDPGPRGRKAQSRGLSLEAAHRKGDCALILSSQGCRLSVTMELEWVRLGVRLKG